MSDVERLERRLAARLGRGIGDFELIEPGDRVLVAVSGGKDSRDLLPVLEAAMPVPDLEPALRG